jgi:hypothetical protein
MTSTAFLHPTGNRKAALPEKHPLFANGEPGGTRTRDPLLKRMTKPLPRGSALVTASTTMPII